MPTTESLKKIVTISLLWLLLSLCMNEDITYFIKKTNYIVYFVLV